MSRLGFLVVCAAGLACVSCKPSRFQGVEVNRGAGLYLEKCAVCHGQDGRSVLPMCPPLRESEWLEGPKEPLIALVLDGLRGPVMVKGRSYNGVMPAWRALLTDEETASVLNFLRREWSGAGEPITPGDVSAIRAATAGRQSFWTVEELRAFRP